MTSTLPRRLGRYEIMEELGRGAMGVVYLARDPLIRRLVALKTFRLGVLEDDEERQRLRQRFIREAQSAGILSHPSIVTIHDVVEQSEEGATFIAMEYIRGTNLKALLQEEGPVDLALVANVVEQIASALDYAHSRGVVHRDIKPANILLTSDRLAKLTDFGIARIDTSNLTQEGQLVGTPNYMAPEQIQGDMVDHRADVFSLGVVIYELLTGSKPFQGDHLTMVTHKVVYEDFEPPTRKSSNLSREVDRILRRALEKDPSRRYPSAGELARELRKALEALRLEASLNETQVIPPDAASAGASATEGSSSGTGSRTGSRTGTGTRTGSRSFTPGAAVAGASSWAGRLAEGLRGLRGLLPSIGPPSVGRPSRARLAVTAAVAAALALGGGWGLLALVTPVSEEPLASAEHQARVRYLPLVREGYEHLQKGDPASAASAFRRAERLAPDRPGLRAMRETAERQAEAFAEMTQREREVAKALVQAQQALHRHHLDEAESAAGAVLELDPENAEAQAVLAESQAERQRQEEEERQRRLAARRSSRSSPVPSSKPPAATSQVAAAPSTTGRSKDEVKAPVPGGAATLLVRFNSQQPEGTLTIFVGQDQLLREPFRFLRRKGFLRSEAYEGETAYGPFDVAPGDTRMRIYVYLGGKPALAKILDTRIVAGTSHELEVSFSAAGDLDARLR